MNIHDMELDFKVMKERNKNEVKALKSDLGHEQEAFFACHE